MNNSKKLSRDLTLFDYNVDRNRFPFSSPLFNDFFNAFEGINAHPKYPKANIIWVDKREDENSDEFEPHYRVELAVAGFSKEELSVTCEDSILRVKGSQSTKSVEPNETYIQQGLAERDFDQYWRFKAPIEVRSAKYDNGLLTLTVYHIPPPKGIAVDIE